jgi:hypothetical protein
MKIGEKNAKGLIGKCENSREGGLKLQAASCRPQVWSGILTKLSFL